MEFAYNFFGSAQPGMGEYPINPGTAVARGQMLALSGGNVVPAGAATAKFLGVAAEDHPGAADTFNPRADGGSIRVYNAAGNVWRVKPFTLTADAAAADSVTLGELPAYSNDALAGGYLKLAAKAASNTGDLPVGTVWRISAYSASSQTVSIPCGNALCAGDTLELYPPVGFDGFACDADGSIALDAMRKYIQCVGSNPHAGACWFKVVQSYCAM